MPRLGDLHVYGTEEMIDRVWNSVSAELTALQTGNPELDEINNSTLRHVFHAGWLACLKAMLEQENRKDGIGG